MLLLSPFFLVSRYLRVCLAIITESWARARLYNSKTPGIRPVRGSAYRPDEFVARARYDPWKWNTTHWESRCPRKRRCRHARRCVKARIAVLNVGGPCRRFPRIATFTSFLSYNDCIRLTRALPYSSASFFSFLLVRFRTNGPV